jgi:methylphosphotriester-DNA--protein-cysteine methyltransferase
MSSEKKVLVNACITTKIFCRPNCPPGRRTKESNRVYFHDIKEAKSAGFRACKVCKPETGVFGRYGPN